MKKVKIAFSLDKSLLDQIDSKVDKALLRSRSQAIEYFLRKGLKEQSINVAVLLIKGEDQQILLKPFKGSNLLQQQLSFFAENGVKKVFIATQHTKDTIMLMDELQKAPIFAEIVETKAKGNAEALFSIRNKLKSSFIVMSGDIYNDFSLNNMINEHLQNDKLATLGLMSRDKASEYGTAILDGKLVINFEEKPLKAKSHVVNAGIYIFKPEVFALFETAVSLEKDVLPKLATMKQLLAYFTMGEYKHFG